MTIEESRQKFEEFADGEGLNLDPNLYAAGFRSDDTQIAWIAWEACRKMMADHYAESQEALF